MENNNAFEYTYSASRQEEIQAIRAKYLPKEEDKFDQLRRLDRSASIKGTKRSITVGSVGTLIFGTGLSLCMVGPDELLFPGIVIGIAGMIAMAAAYPLFLHITKKERERIAPEILRLTEELLQ